MIAVDTNVLVFADRSELPKHAQALAALRELAEGRDAWALLTDDRDFARFPRITIRPLR